MSARSLFVVFVLAALGFGQSPQRVEVPLTFKEFRTVNEMIILSFGGYCVQSIGAITERLQPLTRHC